MLPHPYPHVLGFPLQMALMSRRDFPLALPGLVHLENPVTVHRALSAAEPLDLTVRAEALREHPKGMLVDLLTEVEVGRRACLERPQHLPAPGRAAPAGPRPRRARRRCRPRTPPRSGGSPRDLGRAYAGVCGDVNPIHLHALTARAMGFPRRHRARHVDLRPAPWRRSARAPVGPSTSQVWFRKPVMLPSTVELTVERTAGGVVAGLRGRGGTEHLVLAWSPLG